MSRTHWDLNGNILYEQDGSVVRLIGVSLACGFVSQNDVAYSNLRLISAAPELLTELKLAKEKLQSWKDNQGNYGTSGYDEMFKRIDSVILRAEG